MESSTVFGCYPSQCLGQFKKLINSQWIQSQHVCIFSGCYDNSTFASGKTIGIQFLKPYKDNIIIGAMHLTILSSHGNNNIV